MTQTIAQQAVAQLFTQARSHHLWTDRSVSEATLIELYDTMKWGPTAVNLAPGRFVFITSEAAKAKLYPHLMGSNVEQVRLAPVTVIVAQDTRFFDHATRLFPAIDTTELFAGDAALSEATAFRNSSLQGAYAILAARALGLDTCPMSGFDNNAIDEAFFAGISWRSNFIFTLGYGDHEKLYPRGPRLDFEEACRIA
jgi:3-hydroxypropanoate dehydrogenase